MSLICSSVMHPSTQRSLMERDIFFQVCLRASELFFLWLPLYTYTSLYLRFDSWPHVLLFSSYLGICPFVVLMGHTFGIALFFFYFVFFLNVFLVWLKQCFILFEKILLIYNEGKQNHLKKRKENLCWYICC